MSGKKELILLIFGTVINHDRALMHLKYILALCQNVAFIFIIPLILLMLVMNQDETGFCSCWVQGSNIIVADAHKIFFGSVPILH